MLGQRFASDPGNLKKRRAVSADLGFLTLRAISGSTRSHRRRHSCLLLLHLALVAAPDVSLVVWGSLPFDCSAAVLVVVLADGVHVDVAIGYHLSGWELSELVMVVVHPRGITNLVCLGHSMCIRTAPLCAPEVHLRSSIRARGVCATCVICVRLPVDWSYHLCSTIDHWLLSAVIWLFFGGLLDCLFC